MSTNYQLELQIKIIFIIHQSISYSSVDSMGSLVYKVLKMVKNVIHNFQKPKITSANDLFCAQHIQFIGTEE